jgi:hypothetical protein
MSGDWLFFSAFTAPISESVRCYFANTAPEKRAILRPRPTSSLLFRWNISENSQLPSNALKRSDAQSLEVVTSTLWSERCPSLRRCRY